MVDLNIILKTLCYRRVGGDIWVKPFAATLLVIDFPDGELIKLRLTQWFSEAGGKRQIWNSDIIQVESITDIKSILDLECTTCKGATEFMVGNYSSFIPGLPLAEFFDEFL